MAREEMLIWRFPSQQFSPERALAPVSAQGVHCWIGTRFCWSRILEEFLFLCEMDAKRLQLGQSFTSPADATSAVEAPQDL